MSSSNKKPIVNFKEKFVRFSKQSLSFFALLLALVYCVNTYHQKNIEREQHIKQKQQKEENIKRSVLSLVSRTNAVSDWAKNLEGDGFRTSVKTLELQKAWIFQNRPILFVGVVEDVSQVNDELYHLLIGPSLYSKHMFISTLKVSLLCKKGMMDMAIKEHPEILHGDFGEETVAVVAKIENIKTQKSLSEDFSEDTGSYVNEENIRIGYGECLDFQYLGDAGTFFQE